MNFQLTSFGRETKNNYKKSDWTTVLSMFYRIIFTPIPIALSLSINIFTPKFCIFYNTNISVFDPKN